ncbi:MAG: ATP-dependent DNA helicase RecQ [Akkermansia sp.]|nr:ATP-dependent DNA helicase RecQ [Akkermansia sp.]
MEFTPEAEAHILKLFRKEALRNGQRQLIQLVLAGQNALGVLPTGHGKSLCYQAAAELLGGTSLVISPLIALMRDQCETLRALGISAARFDSTLAPEERAAVLQDTASGQLRILFVAPESLENRELRHTLAATGIALMVVDEAHCVSEWGHSFRPDYLKLPTLQQELSPHATLALTATATPRVQSDLGRAFGIPEENRVVLPPYRSSITRICRPVEDRMAALLPYLAEAANLPAIVYCRTRKESEWLAGELARLGYPAAYYHAGLPADQREQLQDAFLRNEITVLVATIAFGMGIDKPDVRSVVHWSTPSSPESYLQESGRAGRDGAPCTSLILLHAPDLVEARNRILAAEPDPEGVLRCVRWLIPAGRRVVSLWELGTTCDVPDDVPTRALMRLQDSVEIESKGSKYYKVKPLFPMATITDGRDAAECARLRWLDAHREGEVEDAALAWDCSFAEAVEYLYECEAAGEWKLTMRQQALCLHQLPSAPAADARSVAAELSAAFARRREADLARQQLVVDMLMAPTCLNQALEEYFMNQSRPACGHCTACLGLTTTLPPAPEPPPYDPAAFCTPDKPMPEFDRPAQRRRFLLGLLSPGLMARRLWAHPAYGTAAGQEWEKT